MYVLKYFTPEGWKILYNDIINHILDVAESCLKKDGNLSELTSSSKAIENLGLTGKDNTTHYHDSHYLPMFENAKRELDKVENESLKKNSNLGDLQNKSSALINLGLTGNVTSHTHNELQSQIDSMKQRLEEVISEVQKSSELPVGTIIAFPSTATPNSSSVWLLCDGRSVPSTYPELRKLMTNTPNLNGRFLEGTSESNKVNTKVEAALPNIKGQFYQWKSYMFEGAFYEVSGDSGANSKNGGSDPRKTTGFDASRSSSVYKDGCDTVQPPALYTYFYIKAK